MCSGSEAGVTALLLSTSIIDVKRSRVGRERSTPVLVSKTLVMSVCTDIGSRYCLLRDDGGSSTIGAEGGLKHGGRSVLSLGT